MDMRVPDPNHDEGTAVAGADANLPAGADDESREQEAALERLQRCARSRNDADRARPVRAAAVSVPHRILIGARELPGDLIAARTSQAG